MPAWPATLPQRLNRSNFSYTPEDGVIRTRMEQGPVKMRPRFTATTTVVTGTIVVDRTQYQTLDTFYRTTTSYGVTPFDWVDPITEAPCRYRFLAPPLPSAPQGDELMVTVQLEQQP